VFGRPWVQLLRILNAWMLGLLGVTIALTASGIELVGDANPAHERRAGRDRV